MGIVATNQPLPVGMIADRFAHSSLGYNVTGSPEKNSKAEPLWPNLANHVLMPRGSWPFNPETVELSQKKTIPMDGDGRSPAGQQIGVACEQKFQFGVSPDTVITFH